MTVETVPVPAGVGTHHTVEVSPPALLLLPPLKPLHHLDGLLGDLEAGLPVLNGHLHKVQQV